MKVIKINGNKVISPYTLILAGAFCCGAATSVLSLCTDGAAQLLETGGLVLPSCSRLFVGALSEYIGLAAALLFFANFSLGWLLLPFFSFSLGFCHAASLAGAVAVGAEKSYIVCSVCSYFVRNCGLLFFIIAAKHSADRSRSLFGRAYFPSREDKERLAFIPGWFAVYCILSLLASICEAAVYAAAVKFAA